MFRWNCAYCKKSSMELGIGDSHVMHAEHSRKCAALQRHPTDPVGSLIDQLNGGIDYGSITKVLAIRDVDAVDISVIIPVKGRSNFHQVLVDHITAAFMHSGKTYAVTFVEHSDSPVHEHLAAASGSNYIYVPTEGTFNKCLAFNIGFIYSTRAKHYLFHDLDCMMQSGFIFNIFQNMSRHGTDVALQSFRDRRVLYCNEQLTDQIINKTVTVDSLTSGSLNVLEPAKHQWKAPGGSIFCSYDLFMDVGGFDPEYFFGYSIEDAFFYDKLAVTAGIFSCDNPQIELFHLNHPPLWDSNPHLSDHHKIYDAWMQLTHGQKQHIMRIKSEHLKKFIK